MNMMMMGHDEGGEMRYERKRTTSDRTKHTNWEQTHFTPPRPPHQTKTKQPNQKVSFQVFIFIRYFIIFNKSSKLKHQIKNTHTRL